MTDVSAQRKSGGSGCLKGCGIGCLVILIALGALGYAGYRFASKKYADLMAEFEEAGYTRVVGQAIEVDDTVSEPTVYVAQSVILRKGSDRGLGFLCQIAEIDGTVKGNVRFIGQELTIRPGAVLEQELNVQCQVLNLYGTVKGRINGVYQTINKTTGE